MSGSANSFASVCRCRSAAVVIDREGSAYVFSLPSLRVLIVKAGCGERCGERRAA